MMQKEFAAIMGERYVDPQGVRQVVPDATNAAHDWIRRSGIHPINHILTVKTALADANPWLPGELMDMFDRARQVAIADGAEAPPAYGFEKNRASLQCCLQFSADQKITPRVYDVSELFIPYDASVGRLRVQSALLRKSSSRAAVKASVWPSTAMSQYSDLGRHSAR